MENAFPSLSEHVRFLCSALSLSLSRRQLSGEFFPRAMDQKGSLKEPRSELSQGGSIGLRGNSLRPRTTPILNPSLLPGETACLHHCILRHWVYPSAAAAPPGMNNLLPDCLPPSLYHDSEQDSSCPY